MAVDTSALPVFIASSFVLLITPGPDTAFITSTGITQGRKPATFGAMGVSLSMFTHSLIAAAGLSALFAASDVAFEAVRFTGCAYLLRLAVSSMKERGSNGCGGESLLQPGEYFVQGFLTNLLNPKVILFISLFLVQFTSKGHGPIFLQIVSLGALLALMSLVFFTLLGGLAGSLGKAMLGSRAYRTVLSRVMALVFVFLAVRLLVMDKPV